MLYTCVTEQCLVNVKKIVCVFDFRGQALTNFIFLVNDVICCMFSDIYLMIAISNYRLVTAADKDLGECYLVIYQVWFATYYVSWMQLFCVCAHSVPGCVYLYMYVYVYNGVCVCRDMHVCEAVCTCVCVCACVHAGVHLYKCIWIEMNLYLKYLFDVCYQRWG